MATIAEIMSAGGTVDEMANRIGAEYDRLWAEHQSAMAVSAALALEPGEGFDLAVYSEAHIGARKIVERRQHRAHRAF